jgi:hypothetical protein
VIELQSGVLACWRAGGGRLLLSPQLCVSWANAPQIMLVLTAVVKQVVVT